MRVVNKSERTQSLIAAMNIDGIIWHEIISHSSVNSNIFSAFLQRLFIKLAEINLNSVWLIMDNASIHHTEEVRNLIEQTSRTLIFLPPYSPMMNPIEEVFSKIKFFARNMLADPTNGVNLEGIINQSFATVTSSNCYKYFMNMFMKLPAAAAKEYL